MNEITNSTTDTRNVADEFKGWPHQKIVRELDARGSTLEIAVENLERDYNMGTIVRSANAFGVRTVHVIGRRQWNKRGAMKTDAYMTVRYHADIEQFLGEVAKRQVIVIDNVPESVTMTDAVFERDAVMVFGSEKSGVSQQLREAADVIVAIEQFGSTRSLNVGVAAGIALYEWTRRHRLG